LDGDEYVVNGTKIYIGQDAPYNWREAWFWTTCVTTPGAPRHENLGVFAHPADLPGIEEEVLPLIGAEAKKHLIYFRNARIPAKYLVGGPEMRGWDVLQASLRSEHGGGGRIVPQETVTAQVMQYCKEHKRNGKPLSSDPDIQDILVELWIEDQKRRMYTLSTYWTAKTKKWTGKQYKAVQGNLHAKLRSPKLAKALLGVLGPYAVTGDKEIKVLRGAVERAERMGCVTHIAGTPEALKIMMSRGTGMTVPKGQPGKKEEGH
jgi:alkylation response protein AidB-like acyl-CoA dehydrogenase